MDDEERAEGGTDDEKLFRVDKEAAENVEPVDCGWAHVQIPKFVPRDDPDPVAHDDANADRSNQQRDRSFLDDGSEEQFRQYEAHHGSHTHARYKNSPEREIRLETDEPDVGPDSQVLAVGNI